MKNAKIAAYAKYLYFFQLLVRVFRESEDDISFPKSSTATVVRAEHAMSQSIPEAWNSQVRQKMSKEMSTEAPGQNYRRGQGENETWITKLFCQVLFLQGEKDLLI